MNEHHVKDKQAGFPDGWGSDFLSDFQAKAFSNELATFVHAPEWQAALRDVAAVLQKSSSHAISEILKTDEPDATLLFLTAHSQFLGTARPSWRGNV